MQSGEFSYSSSVIRASAVKFLQCIVVSENPVALDPFERSSDLSRTGMGSAAIDLPLR